jgi:hypothetical protein
VDEGLWIQLNKANIMYNEKTELLGSWKSWYSAEQAISLFLGHPGSAVVSMPASDSGQCPTLCSCNELTTVTNVKRIMRFYILRYLFFASESNSFYSYNLQSFTLSWHS